LKWLIYLHKSTPILKKGRRRSLARCYAVLAVYQWQLTGMPCHDITHQFYHDAVWMKAVAAGLTADDDDESVVSQPYDQQLFATLLQGVIEQTPALDAALRPAVDRDLQMIDPVERAILRVGTYELLFSPQLPVAIVINEAIDLTRLFGAEQGHRYVNGVLDRVAQQLHRASRNKNGTGQSS
jgi:N utilization substance protein B